MLLIEALFVKSVCYLVDNESLPVMCAIRLCFSRSWNLRLGLQSVGGFGSIWKA